MSIEIYQWLVPIVAVSFMYRSYKQFLVKKRTRRSLVIWSLFWVAMVILAILPDSMSFQIAHLFGFKDNVNAIIFVALGLLFSISFYYSSMIERLEKQISILVREQAVYRGFNDVKNGFQNRLEDIDELEAKDESSLRA